MKTTTVSQTKYVCENCGATHSDKYKIFKCPVTHKEICTKCATKVSLADKDVYHDYSENADYSDIGNNTVEVHPDAVKATELELDLDRCEYKQKLAELKRVYVELATKLDQAYLKGYAREFNLKGYNLEEKLT